MGKTIRIETVTQKKKNIRKGKCKTHTKNCKTEWKWEDITKSCIDNKAKANWSQRDSRAANKTLRSFENVHEVINIESVRRQSRGKGD